MTTDADRMVTSASRYKLLDDESEDAVLSAVQLGGGISGCKWKSEKPDDPKLIAHLTNTSLRVTVDGKEFFRVAIPHLTCVDVRNQRCRIEISDAPVLNWDLILDKWKLQSAQERLAWLAPFWSPRLLIFTFEDSAGAVLVLRAKLLASEDGPPLDPELPTWAEVVPVFLYGRKTRTLLQRFVFIWSVASLLWAAWQVWENRAAIADLVVGLSKKLEEAYSKVHPTIQALYVTFVPAWIRTISEWLRSTISACIAGIFSGFWYVMSYIVSTVIADGELLFESLIAACAPTLNYMSEVFSDYLPVQILAARYLGWILQLQAWIVGHVGGYLHNVVRAISKFANYVHDLGRGDFAVKNVVAQRHFNVQIWLGYRAKKITSALQVLGSRSKTTASSEQSEEGSGVVSRFLGRPAEPDQQVLRKPNDAPATHEQASDPRAKPPQCFSACVSM